MSKIEQNLMTELGWNSELPINSLSTPKIDKINFVVMVGEKHQPWRGGVIAL